MKKTFYFVVAFLLTLPVVVKADMGPPAVNYSVRISNVNGAATYNCGSNYYNNTKIDCTKDGNTLDYNVVVSIVDEEFIKQGYLRIDDSRYVSTNDIEPLTDKIDLKHFEHKEESEFIVVAEGAYLYNGPSYIFGKTSDNYMIPIGTRVKTKYFDELFAYFEYDGHKGWGCISIYSSESGLEMFKDAKIYFRQVYHINESEKSHLYATVDSVLYTDYITKEKADVVLPAGTKLVYSEQIGNAYKILYNGNYYWFFDSFNVKTDNFKSNDILTFDNIKIYSDTPNESGKLSNYSGVDIPKNTKIKYEYNFNNGGRWDENKDFYEVTYNGTHGWIYDENISVILRDKMYYTTTLIKDIEIYNSPELNGKYDTLKAGTKIHVVYPPTGNSVKDPSSYIYIATLDGKEGYSKNISTDMTYISYSDYEVKQTDGEHPEVVLKNETIEKENQENHKKRLLNSNDNHENKSRRVIFYSIVAAIVVVLVSIVTMVFVNKKKRKNTVQREEYNTNIENSIETGVQEKTDE